MIQEIKNQIGESIHVKRSILDSGLLDLIASCADLAVDTFRLGRKILICGNGGSAADAQHIASEFVVRFETEREALPAIALNANSSSLTAAGNDYSYDKVFSRQVEAFGNKGDLLLAISTSGDSRSIYEAMAAAKAKGMKIVAFLGKDGGKCKELADIPIIIPSFRTARIQEAHITIGHIICSLVDKGLANP